MKKIFFLAMLIFLVGCSSVPIDDGLNLRGNTPSFKDYKGLVVEFVPGNPPNEIDVLVPTFVSVNIANYGKVPANSMLKVYSTSPRKGFDKQFIPIQINGATLDENGKRIPAVIRKELGKLYYSPEEILPKDSTQFFAVLTYGSQSDEEIRFCVTTPYNVPEQNKRCPLNEGNLEVIGAQYDSIAVRNARKEITAGEGESAILKLDFDIINHGGGMIKKDFGDEIEVSFNIMSPISSFQCKSDESVGLSKDGRLTSSLGLNLDDGKAHVTCYTEITPRNIKSTAEVVLRYSYIYTTSTSSIEIKR